MQFKLSCLQPVVAIVIYSVWLDLVQSDNYKVHYKNQIFKPVCFSSVITFMGDIWMSCIYWFHLVKSFL